MGTNDSGGNKATNPPAANSNNKSQGGKSFRPGRTKGNTVQNPATFKGHTPALAGYIFDYGPGLSLSPSEQVKKSWEKLVSYVGRNHGQHMKTELETLTTVTIATPKYPKHIWDEYEELENKRIASVQSELEGTERSLQRTQDALDRLLSSEDSIAQEDKILSLDDKVLQLKGRITKLTKSLRKEQIVLTGDIATEYSGLESTYKKEVQVLKEARGTVYEIIRGQCTDRLLDMMEKHPDWKTIHETQLPLDLYFLIESLALQSNDDTYPYAIWYDAWIALISCKQDDHQTNLAYAKRFEVLVRVYIAQGGRFYIPSQLDYETALRPASKIDGITSYRDLPQDIQDEMLEIVTEKAMAYILLRQSAPKHEDLRTDIRNRYSHTTTDAYPPTKAEVHRLMDVFISNSTKKTNGTPSQGTAFVQTSSNNKRKGRGKKANNNASDSQSVSTKSTITASTNTTTPNSLTPAALSAHLPKFDAEKWKDGYCTYCQRKGHPASHCFKKLRKEYQEAESANNNIVRSPPVPSSGSSVHTGALIIHGNEVQLEANFLNTSRVLASIFSQNSPYQGDLPLRDVILLDSQSTMDIFCNRSMVTSVYTSPSPCQLQSNGGTMTVTKKATVTGLRDDVWFHPRALSNILSLQSLRSQFPITYNSDDSCFVVHREVINGKPNLFFREHASGLHYFNPTAPEQFTFLTTVDGNMAHLTQRQIQGAEQARELYSKLAFPSLQDFKWIIQSNSIKDCPVTLTDIKLAERIWGPNIAALKGKTTRSSPLPVAADYLEVPQEILDLHKDVYLTADLFFVNKTPFFLTYSRNICFTTVTHMPNRKLESIAQAYQAIHSLYANRGFRITTLSVDNEFAPLQGLLQALPDGPRVNVCSANEHVPEIERRIRVVKERVRSLRHTLPFSHLPELMLIHMVLHCVRMLNYFPPKGSISSNISPRTLLTGDTLSFKKDFSVPFGAYCQVHEQNAPRNGLTARTQDAICLGSSQNIQGGYKFMSLTTGHLLKRYSWTEVPLTQVVIDSVNALGKNEPSLSTFLDRRQRPLEDLPQITGVDDGNDPAATPDPTPMVIDDTLDDEVSVPDVVDDDDNDPSQSSDDGQESPHIDDDDPTHTDPPAPAPEPTDSVVRFTLPEAPPDQTTGVPAPPVPITGVRRSTRTIRPPTQYTPTFTGKSYHTSNAQIQYPQVLHPDAHLSFLTHEVFAHPTDSQIIMTQLSLKVGLKTWGDRASEAVHSEMKQLHFRDTFQPKHWKDLDESQRKSVLESHMFLKEKRDGKIKGRTVAGGNKQRDYISKEDASSPTVATEAVLLTCIIDAEEGRDVAVVDIPNAFIQTKIEDEADMAIIKLRGILVDMLLDIAPAVYQSFVTTDKAGSKQLIVQCKNAIYGTMVASRLYYRKFSKSLIDYGFEFNPYDPCVANKMIDGSQMTICFHVDDCKISHVSSKVMDDVIAWLKQEYESIFEDGSGQMTVSRGKVHKYLGMTLDFATPKQVKVTMFDYVQEILAAFDAADPKATGIKSSAAPEELFRVKENCEKLDPTMAKAFHNLVAKTLYTTKRARPDTSTAIAFLTTRVREPDMDDWAKLTHLMKYLRGTKELPLILSASKNGILKWYVDGSFGVHPNMRGHTGGGLSLGRGFPIVSSVKQKLNTRSSTESEIVAVDDCMPAICWTRYFLEAQGYGVFENIVYQDNQSAILLEKNGRASSSKRTKHINIRYFFVTDRINKKEMTVEWCPTGQMVADFMTKPVQGSLFQKFRDIIMGVDNIPSVVGLVPSKD